MCNKPYVRPIPPAERCETKEIRLAINNALIRYDNYLKTEIAEFDSTFAVECMNKELLQEQINIAYTDRTYHYTLYHYDRAGNLIKTVPPSGIDFENEGLAEADRNTLVQDRITKTAVHRADPTQTRPLTYHSLVTQYKYNSLNALVWSQTPDGGVHQTWYDGLARPVLSQNATQAIAGTYAYIAYDALGRATESGKIAPLHPPAAGVTASYTAVASNMTGFLAVSSRPAAKTEVTRSQYDVPAAPQRIAAAFADLHGQQNTRNAVAAITYEAVNDNNATTYDHGSYYTYDALGNVDRYVQDLPELEPLGANLYALDYTYDLISGNVHTVAYQAGKADQFYHRYAYDAQNRLKTVYTAQDAYQWERDAGYDYYFHGPLARTELGQLGVQGVDYSYSLQGWLKHINGPVMNASYDIGKDGDYYGYNSGVHHGNYNPHQYVAQDAISTELTYYSGDYEPIRGGAYSPSLNSSDVEAHTSDLYNGNISKMTTSIATESDYSGHRIIGDIMANVYRYDQLNRITQHRVFQNYSGLTTGNTWLATGTTGTGAYYESFAFDAAGNITGLTRHGHKTGQVAMDDFTYHFDKRAVTSDVLDARGNRIQWNALHTNKLYHVYDAQADDTRYTNDIDDSGTPFTPYAAGNINAANTYGYDALGNLTRDQSSSIADITWTLTGKIKSITRTSTNPDNLPDLEFGYTASGTRLYKIVKPRQGGVLSSNEQWTIAYYIGDASGTAMATYKRAYKNTVDDEYTDELTLDHHLVYGSSRLGVVNENRPLYNRDFVASIGAEQRFERMDYRGYSIQTLATVDTEMSTLVRGKKRYELSNHLGNVLAVVQDRKRAIQATRSQFLGYYVPYIVETHDYYAYGSLMEDRGFSTESYRFGFQGQEGDDEVSGEGNSWNYKYRMHDARLGRFFAVDPLAPEYPWYSPYQFSGNRVIDMIELEGLEPVGYQAKEGDHQDATYKGEGENNGNVYSWYYNGDAWVPEMSEVVVGAKKPLSTENRIAQMAESIRHNAASADDYFKPGGEGGRAINDFATNVPIGLENALNSINPYLRETANAFIDGDFDKFVKNTGPIYVPKLGEEVKPMILPENAAEYGQFAGGLLPILLTRGNARSLTLVKRGSKEWQAAVKAIRNNRKTNIRVATASDAKALLNEARGNMNRYKQYSKDRGVTYKKGYETHNVQNSRELGAGNDLQHIKWKDSKSGGHIYYDKPN